MRSADTIEDYSASFAFTRRLPAERRLFRHHIVASMAHTRMLARQGALSHEETGALLAGLVEILENPPDLSGVAFADVHAAVDAALHSRLGAAGHKLAGARSRNDQAATDIRLWTREEILAECETIATLQRVLLRVAEAHGSALMPGYAHSRRIHPVLLGHHLLAYHEMLYRDSFRLRETYVRSDILPLGAGDLAGAGSGLDRAYAARLLGMHAVTRNSLDAVGDRDFLIEHLSELAIMAMHLSRLAEDVLLWSTAELGFVAVADDATTEVLRGRTGRVYGALSNALIVMKGLPLSYHDDLREQNEPYFDAAEALRAGLAAAAHVVESVQWNVERMQLGAEACRAVRDGQSAADVAAAQDVRGGTAPSRVTAAVAEGYGKIEFLEAWVAERRSTLPDVERLLDFGQEPVVSGSGGAL